MSAKQEKGGYILLIAHDKNATITVGKLGTFSLSSGYYLYCGSARGGIPQRVNRHLREKKRVHWHIDYLLQYARIVEVWYLETENRVECLFAQAASGLPQAKVLVPGFGSSDCRCPAHLIYSRLRPALKAFQAKLEQVSDRRIPPLMRLEIPGGARNHR